jgi:hypothetical protein
MPRSPGGHVVVVRRWVVLAVTSVAVLSFPSAARAQSAPPSISGPAAPAVEDQVVLSGTVTVPKGTSVGEIVVFHGRVQVTGSVVGDIVVVSGSITVTGGYVTGSVIALHGPIRITAASQIGGDVLASQHVTVDPGVKVGGQVRENVGFTLIERLTAIGAVLGGLAVGVSVLLLGLLLLWVAPRAADAVARTATAAPFASAGWGVLLWLGVPIVCVAALASVLALPLGFALLLALGLAFLLGLTWSTWTLGRAIVHDRGRVLPFLAGWAIVAAIGLVPYVNAGVWTLASIFGLGAMTVAAWRARGRHRGRHRVGVAQHRDHHVFVPEPSASAPAAEHEPAPVYPATSDD